MRSLAKRRKEQFQMFPQTNRPRIICWASLMLLIVSATARLAPADQIVLKNGDRITGTIQSADDGKLIILSPIAGTITVALSDVKTFSTDGPIKIVLDDGTVINQAVTPGKDGTIRRRPPTDFWRCNRCPLPRSRRSIPRRSRGRVRSGSPVPCRREIPTASSLASMPTWCGAARSIGSRRRGNISSASRR